MPTSCYVSYNYKYSQRDTVALGHELTSALPPTTFVTRIFFM